MYFKVITVTLVTICAADNRMLLTKLDSDQELPALRFNGHVLFPAINKYAKVDQYSTLTSILRPVRHAPPNTFRKLQYAPLLGGDNQKNKNAAAEYSKVTPTPTPSSAPSEPTELFSDKISTLLYTKSHLEPRPEAKDTKCYAPGYKVEASVSRSPGHNAVYRIIPEPIEIKKPAKVLLSQAEANPLLDVEQSSLATIDTTMELFSLARIHHYNNRHTQSRTTSRTRLASGVISDYIKPIGINLKLESLTTTVKPSHHLASEILHRPSTLTNEHFVINPVNIETIVPVQVKSKRYTPHGKYHRLHLNIARVYSPGQVPPKSAVFPGNYGKRPPIPQVYIPQAYRDMNLNTMLYPVKGHRKGYRFRTSIIHF